MLLFGGNIEKADRNTDQEAVRCSCGGGKTLELTKKDSFASSRTLVRFTLACATLYLVAIMLPETCFGPINRLTVRLAWMLLDFFQVPSHVVGTTISLGAFRSIIVTECSGIYLCLLFVSFLVSVPAPLKVRFIGVLVGIPFLNLANAVRIATVTAIGAWQPRLFEYAHVYLMQIMMVMLVCVACLAWIRWGATVSARDTPLVFLIRFVALSTVLFLLWLPVHRYYVAFLDRLVIFLFSQIDFVLFIPLLPEIYHHTLSLVVFAALALASRGIGARAKVRGLAVGISLLALVHLLFRVTQVLWSAMGLESVFWLHLAIHVTNQYLLPVLLWMVLLRQQKRIFGRPCPEAACAWFK